MGFPPVATGPLALLDDGLDRGSGTGHVCDRQELGPPELGTGDLGLGRSHEEPFVPELGRQMAEALLYRAVEVAHRRELLGVRDDVVTGHERDRLSEGAHPLGVVRGPSPRDAPSRGNGGAPVPQTGGRPA